MAGPGEGDLAVSDGVPLGIPWPPGAGGVQGSGAQAWRQRLRLGGDDPESVSPFDLY